MTFAGSSAEQGTSAIPGNAAGLSVAIISFNEEANIARCVEAVQAIADEIVIVDSFSTDGTVNIAEAMGARVYSETWKGHTAQKNSALEKCTGAWILSVDCDEVVSPELRESIRRVLADAGAGADGYRVNRKTFFLGKWIEHAWYPDWKLRLIRHGSGRWGGIDPHDTLIVSGSIGTLDGDLRHYSFRDLRDCLERQVRYSLIGSDSYYQNGRRATLAKLVLSPLHSFFKHYVIKRGFLDGRRGLIVSALSGISVFFKYLLLWERQQEREGGDR
jgi:glycosyltransferase involved in cell wall biosynthesis